MAWRSLTFGSLPLLLTVALGMPAGATSHEDACSQVTPCEWVADLDDGGFLDSAAFEATQGDWVQIDLFNLGDAPRTVRFEGYGKEWVVGAGETLTTPPLELAAAGDFRLVDAGSGDARVVHVYLSDVADDDPVTEEGAKASPDVALPLAAIAVLGVAGLRRKV